MRTSLKPLAFALVAVGICTPAFAGKTDVNATMKNAINANAAAKAAVLAKIGVSDPANWNVASIRVTKIKPVNMQMQMPPMKLEFITSTEILNCAPTATSRTVTLGKEVTNSVSVTKTETLDIGAEVSVSASYMGVSGSATASTNYSMSTENAQTNSTTTRVEDSIQVAFDSTGGRMSVLQANKLTANQIPWTATFTPEDNEQIAITAEKTGTGKVCIYQHHSYGGKSKCYTAPTEVAWIGKDWNDEVTSFKIEGPISLTVFEHTSFGGKQKTFTSNVSNVGKEWNDKLSGFKAERLTRGGSATFGSIRSALPKNAQEFRAAGTISVSETKMDGKRITNYEFTPAEVASACGNRPIMAAAQSSPGASAVRAAPGAQGDVAPRIAATAPAVAQAVQVRELTEAEALAKMKTAKKLN